MKTIDAVQTGFQAQGYIADRDLATAVHLLTPKET